jgi:hypothetical protein
MPPPFPHVCHNQYDQKINHFLWQNATIFHNIENAMAITYSGHSNGNSAVASSLSKPDLK